MTSSIRFSYATVRESHRRAIFVVRVEDALLEPMEIDEVTDRMREKLASRGNPCIRDIIPVVERLGCLRGFGLRNESRLVQSLRPAARAAAGRP